MGIHNSLDLYRSLTKWLYHDIANEASRYQRSFFGYNHDVFERDRMADCASIDRRYAKEGIEYLTRTLPTLGKAFDKALLGEAPFTCPGFRSRNSEIMIPKFLSGITSCIFNQTTGMVLLEPFLGHAHHARLIKGVRTFLYFTYKLDLPYDVETERKVLDSFIETEEEIAGWICSSETDSIVDSAASLLWEITRECNMSGLRPKHGPGNVSTGEKGWEKINFSRRYADLHWWFPLEDYFFLGKSHMQAHKKQVADMKLTEPTAKVVLVPKDSRGPRLISCEPLEIQWIQQGIMQRMVTCIESHPLTRDHVNFTCQDINRELARLGSTNELNGSISWTYSKEVKIGPNKDVDAMKRITRTKKVPTSSPWVTLDMKDASDRVSYELVERLFEKTPWWSALRAARSTSTILPDGKRVKLAKFAPMGSATCFPVEALVFFALAVAALHARGVKPRWRQCAELVYVYGDDLIVRQEDYLIITAVLEDVGLKVNKDKCCVSGFFRESCGLDAYRGFDVTPLRLRKTFDQRVNNDATQLVSWVSLSNSLSDAGYWCIAEHMATIIEETYGFLPCVPYSVSPEIDLQSRDITGWWGVKAPSSKTRVIGFSNSHVTHGNIRHKETVKYLHWCNEKCPKEHPHHLHKLLIYGWVVEPVIKFQRVNHRNMLFHTLVCGTTGSKRIGQLAVPHRSQLKRGFGVSN